MGVACTPLPHSQGSRASTIEPGLDQKSLGTKSFKSRNCVCSQIEDAFQTAGSMALLRRF